MRATAFALSLLTGSAQAAEIPARFRGVWTNAASTSSCPADGGQAQKAEGLRMTVTATSVSSRTASCNVAAVSVVSQVDAIVVALSCTGDGQDYQAKELWKRSAVKDTPVLATSDLDRPFLSIYMHCE